MKAMLLRELAPLSTNPQPLHLSDMPEPTLQAGEILIRVSACGVCHTELDEIEGRTSPPRLPVVLGHQVVGVVQRVSDTSQAAAAAARQVMALVQEASDPVEALGGVAAAERPREAAGLAFTGNFPAPAGIGGISSGFPTGDAVGALFGAGIEVSTSEGIRVGQRVGVAWINSACGTCKQCRSGNENLCTAFQATGRDADGGYAQFMKVRADFAYPIPENLSDSEAAPLLCAGAVGYRALRLSNLSDGENLGLMGFGASNHLILKMVRHKYPDARVFVLTRSPEERAFAMSLGAAWAGAIDEKPPERLDAIIDATPVWRPVLEALKHLAPGRRLVVNAIRKEETDKDSLQKLDYTTQLWMEKEIKSVANVTRQDVREFLQLASEAGIKPEVQEFALKDANQALMELKRAKIRGAKVLRVE